MKSLGQVEFKTHWSSGKGYFEEGNSLDLQ